MRFECKNGEIYLLMTKCCGSTLVVKERRNAFVILWITSKLPPPTNLFLVDFVSCLNILPSWEITPNMTLFFTCVRLNGTRDCRTAFSTCVHSHLVAKKKWVAIDGGSEYVDSISLCITHSLKIGQTPHLLLFQRLWALSVSVDKAHSKEQGFWQT